MSSFSTAAAGVAACADIAEEADLLDAACPKAITPAMQTTTSRVRTRALKSLPVDLIYSFLLGVNAALADSVRYAVNRQHVSGDTIVDVVSLGITDHIFEGRLHDGVELLVDHRLFPEITLPVLHPLEIRSGHAPGIGQNVGDHEDALVGEDVVGSGGCRSVRAFGEDAALHAVGVAAGDDIFRGGGNKNFALRDEQVGSIALLRAGESVDGPVFLAEIHQSLQVDAVRVVQAAANLGNANHLITCLMHQQSGIGAHVAEALHDDAGSFAIQSQLLTGFIADDHYAAASGLAASAGAADVDGFSGHACRYRLAHVHGVGIHHPRHDLFVGIDVGGGNVFFRADEFDQFGGVAPSHTFDFAH